MKSRSIGEYEPIFTTIYQFWLARALHAFIELNLANRIRDTKVHASTLANTLKQEFPNVSGAFLYRLLRALAITGILQADNDDKFSLSPLGKELCDPAVHERISKHFTQAHWESIAKLSRESNAVQLQSLATKQIVGISNKLNSILFMYRASKALYLFTQLNLADQFINQRVSVNDLVNACKLDKESLQVICTLLTEQNILREHHQQYELTPAGEMLLSNNTFSLKNVVLHENTRRWLAAANLARAITENKDPFTLTFNQDLFTLLSKLHGDDKAEFDIFNRAMSEISAVETVAIRHMNIQPEVNTVMDVGGGTGALMLSILQEHQHLNGIIFDLPETVGQLRLSEKRCRAIGGSFFEPQTIPSCDMVIMKRALHDWSNDKAIVILKNCAAKCRQLNIIEWLWRDNAFVASLDLGLLSIGGKIRSEQEFKDLFAAAEIDYIVTQELGPGIFAVCGSPTSQPENKAEITHKH